jgi:hypothetical protein
MDSFQPKTCVLSVFGPICGPVCGLLLCALLAGCGSAIPRHAAGVWVGDQGSGSEVVFDAPLVLAARDRAREEGRTLASADTFWKDRSLSIRPLESAYDQAAWPSPTRPSLDQPRRIYFNQRTDTFLFFRQESTGRTRERGVSFLP